MTLTQEILAYARELGFDLAGITPAGKPPHGEAFAAWLAADHHGQMAYLAARAAERLDPARWAPDAHSIILLGVNYETGPAPAGPEPAVETAAYPCETGPAPAGPEPAVETAAYPCETGQAPAGPEPAVETAAYPCETGLRRLASGRIARYAIWPDYHDVLKPKLYALDAFIRARTGRQTLGKIFVDSAPVLERDFAEQAGLGFIGRNCCLITPGLGSWTVLAGLMVPEDLTPSPSPAARDASDPARRGEQEVRCGRCTRCLDACPAHAFSGPHVLDARRCISYLTIEQRGPIPRELRPLMGNWVFGCDVCQEVCPYNRGSRFMAVETAATAAKSTFVDFDPVGAGRLRNGSCDFPSPLLSPVLSPGSLALSALLTLDEATFRARFRGTPVLRAKRRGLVRNACVAAGNSGDPALVPALIALLADPEPLVRGHAAWALGRVGGADAEHALAHALTLETDPWVRSEIAS